MAGLTIAKLTPNADNIGFGNVRVKVRTITFDSSYPTGGEALAAADVGLRKIHAVIPCGPAIDSNSTAVIVRWNATTNKLMAFRQKDPADTGGADIALPQVGNTIDLSGFSVLVVVIGY